MPAPSANRPLGVDAVARLRVTTLCSRVRLPACCRMPAPSASLVSGPATSLSLTLVLRSVSAPELSIPPPPASAKRQGPAGQIERTLGTVVVGATRLPAMTLSATVTVAPVAPSAAGGIAIPPPKCRGLLVVRAADGPAASTCAGDAAGDRHALDRHGRHARRIEHADRDHGPAAADDRGAGARADQLHARVDRDAALERPAADHGSRRRPARRLARPEWWEDNAAWRRRIDRQRAPYQRPMAVPPRPRPL